ncbi:MAG: hypothetical protein K2M64_04240 [Clostridia bacterium]|nr:hypothetical protein [Clostridia bacterium]
MKRRLITILSLIVVVTLSFGILAACQNGLKTEQLDALYKAFTKKHNNEATETPASYWLEGDVFDIDADGKEFSAKIKWTIEGTTLVTVNPEPNAIGQYQIVVPEEDQDTAINYKLIGTLVDENGKAYTNKDGETYKWEMERVVPAGKTYKIAVRQLTLGTVLYAKAEKAPSSDYYIGSAETAIAGADFHTEKVEGGYKIYTMVGSTKSYLGAEVSGKYNNVILGGIVSNTDAATYEGTVWTIDNNELKTTVGSKTLYLGTYASYNTFSVSDTKTYPAFLVEAGTDVSAQTQAKAASANDERVTVTFTDPAPVEGVVTADIGATVKFTVALEGGITLVSVSISQNAKLTELTATDGVYSFELTAATDVLVEIEDPNARVDELMATLTIDDATATIAEDGQSKSFTYEGYPDITVTNNKASSSSNITTQYDTPSNGSIRCYKSSSLTIDCEGMLSVIITVDGYDAKYANAWDGVKVDGATVVKKGTQIIITFEEAVDTFTTTTFGDQTRITKIEIFGAPTTGTDAE